MMHAIDATVRHNQAKGKEMARINTTLAKSDETNLDRIVAATELDRNDAVRKALATEAFVQEHLKSGAKLLIEMPDGRIKQIEFVG